MQVDNNINSMQQLSNQLEKSSKELAKLNKNYNQTSQIEQKENQDLDTPDLTKEMLKQIEIPIAYTANAEVISVQDAVQRTLLDIKA